MPHAEYALAFSIASAGQTLGKTSFVIIRCVMTEMQGLQRLCLQRLVRSQQEEVFWNSIFYNNTCKCWNVMMTLLKIGDTLHVRKD